MTKRTPIRALALVALAAPLLLAGCKDDKEAEGDLAQDTTGGETTAGTAGEMTGAPGSVEPDEGGEDWDADESGGGGGGTGGGGGGGAAGGGGGAAGGGGGGESPWGATREEQCSGIERSAMSSRARSAFQRGVELANKGHTDKAKAQFEKALRADSDAFKVLYNLGVMADRKGNEGQALDYYQRALSAQPDYEKAAKGIVTIRLRNGATSQALSFIEGLANRYKANKDLQATYAEVLVKAGKHDQAWNAARRALKCDERFVPAMIALVKASMKQGRDELAENILDQALGVTDKNAELHYLKAQMLLAEDGRLREALEELEKAVELRPDYLAARMALGVQRLAGANYDDALKHFKVAAMIAPKLVSVHLNLGDAYRAKEEWQRAKQSFQQALSMEPELPEAYFNQGLMYMAAGEDYPGLSKLDALKKAKQMFERYRDMMGPKLDRDDPSESYLSDLKTQIEREQSRIERERERDAREAESGGGGDSGGGDSGGGGGGG